MKILGAPESGFDEDTWGDSTARSSFHVIEAGRISHGTLSATDLIDYFEINVTIGLYRLLVTSDPTNGRTPTAISSDSFSTYITDRFGALFPLQKDFPQFDIATETITFEAVRSGTFYVEIRNDTQESYNYAAILQQLSSSVASVSISSDASLAVEGLSGKKEYNFTLQRSGDTTINHTVYYNISGSGGQQASENDFGGAFPSGSITFAAGETVKTLTVDVLGDAAVEADEGFTVILSNPSTGLTIGTGAASATILNDDTATVSIVSAQAVRVEGNGSTGNFTFLLSLDRATEAAQTVQWTVSGAGSNPADAADFGGTLPTGTINFLAGETTKLLTVSTQGDTVAEGDESFVVSLSSPSSGLLLGASTATASILNDDSPTVSIDASSASRAEGVSGKTAFTFTVRLGQALADNQTVAWSVVGTGANPASATDFDGVLPAGTLTFAAGETTKTFSIEIAGDAEAEPDEGFVVNLSNPSSGVTLSTPSAAVTILNDDLEALPDAFVVLQGQGLTLGASAGVLANDAGASLAQLVAAPSTGRLNLQADGGFNYTPLADFSGLANFTYRAGTSAGTTQDVAGRIHVVPTNVGATTTLALLELTPEEQIAATYAAFFGRGADAGGFNFWVNEFDRGLNELGKTPKQLFADIASSFGVSDEAKALYDFLADPAAASDTEISDFLVRVYDNLFNRAPDAEGLAYWTGRVREVLAGGVYVGNVLVDIMSGTQNTPAGQDITTLMSKVVVGLHYVEEGARRGNQWTWADDQAEAMALLDRVTNDPATVLIGIAEAQALVIADL